MSDSVLVHVQHLLGIGHQRRTAAITRELCRAGFDVCYVCGGFPISGLDVGTAELVQLPATRALSARYDCLVDERGDAIDDVWRERRKQQLLHTFHRTRPRVVVVEGFPFARRMFSFELLPLLEAARAMSPPPLIVSSVRDILEPKRKPGRNEQIVARIRSHFDLVLVHGDPRFVALADSFSLAEQIADWVEYTGYVIDSSTGKRKPQPRSDDVLISTGSGGFGGEQLLRVAVAARKLIDSSSPLWRCMVGDSLPDSLFDELRLLAPDGMSIERNRNDFYDLLCAAAVSVSQAGYNTVMEVLDAGTAAVLIPFSDHNESEQSTRAGLLNSRALACLLPPAQLNPQNLLAAIETARQRARSPKMLPDMSGAATTATLIRERLRGHQGAG